MIKKISDDTIAVLEKAKGTAIHGIGFANAHISYSDYLCINCLEGGELVLWGTFGVIEIHFFAEESPPLGQEVLSLNAELYAMSGELYKHFPVTVRPRQWEEKIECIEVWGENYRIKIEEARRELEQFGMTVDPKYTDDIMIDTDYVLIFVTEKGERVMIKSDGVFDRKFRIMIGEKEIQSYLDIKRDDGTPFYVLKKRI